MEIQQKIELYGENWKQVEQQKIQQEIEKEIGGDNVPKIYDSKDLYDFFNPILFYKDPENKVLNMDYNKFDESIEQYKYALEEINESIKESKKSETDKDDTTENVTEESNKTLVDDGTSETDKDIPIDEKTEVDENNRLKNNVDKQDTAAGRAKGKIHQIVSTYFNRFVPLYNKHVCTCCGMPQNIENYYVVYNISCSDRVDDKGSYHMWVCKECVQKLFAYYYSVLSNKNIELAMQYLCASLNLYWDVDIFYKARQNFEDSGRKKTLTGAYISEINKEAIGMTFMDSPFLADEQYNSTNRTIQINPNEAPYDWDQKDVMNKKTAIRIVGYDPFESTKDEETKKILYRDFCSLIDEELAQDYVKCQSAITIVRSFLKVRQLDEKMTKLEEENASLNEQKAVSDLKKKELDSITSFCASNGWSERFKSKVAKGETSFTGIMKAMNEKNYESAIANKFDIQTGATMQQAADISINAIMKQLSLSEAEVWKITQDQYAELVKLRKSQAKLEEDLRKARYELAEIRLRAKMEKDDEVG